MLYHHDSRDYQAAASEAAKHARSKLESLIDAGRSKALALLDTIADEVPTDMVVPTQAINYVPVDNTIAMGIDNHGVWNVHPHALAQIVDKTGILNRTVATRMSDAGEWGKDLLAHCLNEINRRSRSRVLVRGVKAEVRGYLSDRYRRMDSWPIIDSYLKATTALDCVPVDGHAMTTKWALKMMLPRVYEPVENEVMAFGMVLSNSDYGDGALSLRAFSLRLWCTNTAIREECMRKVHLGSRLSDNMTYSQRTYQLDSETIASAIEDVVGSVMCPDRINAECAVIEAAHQEKINPKKTLDALQKKGLLSKQEQSEISEAYNAPDIELLPPGQSKWRLANAISLIAGRTADQRRQFDLQLVAGKILN